MQPDLLTSRRSPQPFGGSHRMPACQQDSDDVNSVASYENQGGSRVWGTGGVGEAESVPGHIDFSFLTEPTCIPVVSSAPVSSNPGLRDSAFSMESGEDYVNVPESEDSAEASLDGSREYVNVSQELQPVSIAEQATVTSQEVEDEGEDEGVEGEEAPDYENLHELN
ncbi:Linker for activation of T-cells family member 1 [Lemmus lemmus]